MRRTTCMVRFQLGTDEPVRCGRPAVGYELVGAVRVAVCKRCRRPQARFEPFAEAAEEDSA
ncbi:MAG: hypothetical protein V3U45_04870 [bacterium]